ncbi:TatD DNase family protein [Cetobacterium ceti]|uniref:TatD DNase family protein n=1 Tax=Cetobacterium ceti TaxID=180163 RepID=A0A1T4Q0Y7_9FUSO|nr:TatD family hydrolase [Cetobacterium ceti]SJZ97453.1 TatD DNase family protein [Cetobacterium ceti]
MKLVDTHCHIDNEKFNEDRIEVIKRIEENLEFAVNIGYDLESSRRTLRLTRVYDCIYGTVGFHPTDISKYTEEAEKELEDMAREEKIVAIGEIGLDYYWMEDPKEKQQEIFRRQLKLAQKLNMPVSIHTRDAMEDTVKILKEFPDIKGVIHCYPGSVETAKELIDRFYLGIGGALTFKNAKKLVNVVKEIPLDRLVLETDCPYMAPEPNRGKRNEPIYVKFVGEKIAEIKGISYEEVAKVTTENAKRLYSIGDR